MGQQKNLLTGSLDDAIAMIDTEILEVVGDLDLEKANLEELVSAAETETQKHLAELRGSIKGLQSRLNDLKETLLTAREQAGQLQNDEEEAPAQSSADPNVEMDAGQASRERHDKPVSLGEILRSLLMANEPAQRERARGNDHPSEES